MLLTIDIGNTNITFGTFEAGECRVKHYAHSKTDRDATSYDAAMLIENLLRLWKVSPDILTDVIVASVVPQVDYPFAHGLQKAFSIEPKFVKNSDVPMKNNYEYPNEVGADRIVNAYAGIQMFPATSLIIVDFGTATTFDVVSEAGSYEGGAIIPGLMTSLRSMESKAAKLPMIDLSAPTKVVGKNTIDSIRSGLLNGAGAMTDELVRRIVEEMGWKRWKVISTGGLSEMVKTVSRSIETIDLHLTLKGLYYIWKIGNEK